MRFRTMVAAAVAAVGMAAPAAAQDLMPGDITSYSQTISNLVGAPSQPFNSALGRLIGVHLDIGVQSSVGYFFNPVLAGSVATIGYTASSNVTFAGVDLTTLGSGSRTTAEIFYVIGLTGSQSVDLDPAPYAAGYRLGPYGGDGLLSSSGSAFLQPGVATAIGSATFTSDVAGTLFKDAGGCGASRGFDACDNAYGILTFTYVVAGVPEPESWDMMLLGFAAIGIAFRRKKALGLHRA